MIQKTAHFSLEVCKDVINNVGQFPLHKLLATGVFCTYTHILHEGKAFVPVFALVILDAIVGVMKAKKNGTFKGSQGFKRSAQKFLVYVVMLLASGILDMEFPGQYASGTMKTFLMVTEAVSIMENISALGWPVPLKLLKMLKMQRDDAEQEKESDSDKEK